MGRTLSAFLFGLVVSEPAAAQAWNAVNAQVLYGSGFELDPRNAETLTIEWANSWAYGDNFTFFDITRPLGGGTHVYGEWAPRLSFSKISGRSPTGGLVQDMLLSGTLEVGEGIANYLIGAAVDLTLPGFNLFQINGYLRENPDLSGTTWQVTVVWDAALETGRLRWAALGFFDWFGSEGTPGTGAFEKSNFQAQPQLLLDMGHLMGQPDRFYVGVEWLYWDNKYGVDGVSDSVVQAMIKVTF